MGQIDVLFGDRLNRGRIHGSDSIDHIFTLGKLASPGKAILVNYNADVLSDN